LIRILMLGLTRGSPPVNLILSTPKFARIVTIRIISSKASILSCSNQSLLSVGIQYIHRILHLSVTEMRSFLATLPKLSTRLLFRSIIRRQYTHLSNIINDRLRYNFSPDLVDFITPSGPLRIFINI